MTIFVVEILKYKHYFSAQPILYVEINIFSLVISEQNKLRVLLSIVDDRRTVLMFSMRQVLLHCMCHTVLTDWRYHTVLTDWRYHTVLTDWRYQTMFTCMHIDILMILN